MFREKNESINGEIGFKCSFKYTTIGSA